VKIRGYRVELGEIEAALAKLPAVREAAVVARDDERGTKRLVAYVVPGEGAAASASALREGLGASLPEFMVPSAFVFLDRLPLTPNGKVDRRALPAPALEAAAAFVAPSNPIEELVASVFADLLKLPSVSAVANFFELGGHSLLATRAVARVRELFGVDLPL